MPNINDTTIFRIEDLKDDDQIAIGRPGFNAATVVRWGTLKAAIQGASSPEFSAHINNKANPHAVTAAQVGLGNVNNTSDANKPVSTAQQSAIDAAKTKVLTAASESAAKALSSANPGAIVLY